MSETKFTKGEWSILGDWGICKNGWETDLIATFEPRGVGQREGFANAHLIAAAPEMYEMLEKIHDSMAGNGEYGEFYYDVKSLLAKVRGEND